MANKYLNYEGLAHFLSKLDERFAPIQAIVFQSTVEDIASLPTLANEKAGYMYNIKTGGLTTPDFVEGAGHIVADGENVAVVELRTGVYTNVASVAVTDDPKAEGWFEVNAASAVTPVGTENPSEEGWYEEASGIYTITADTTIDSGKTYYSVTFKLSTDRIADTTKGYYTADAVKKWDILGGVFDLEGRYLEFGETFPQGPASRMVDGRTFLFMGDTVKGYTYVASPSGRPKDEGYFEGTFTAVADQTTIFNPHQQGLYEADGTTAGVYVLSADKTRDTEKTYYEGTFVASTDTTVNPAKFYYTEADLYKKAAIYEYDSATNDWVIQSGGSDDFIAITNAEIDELFI